MRKSTRTPSPDRAKDEPKLVFTEGTPYDQYVGASALHRMQTMLTDEPEEMPFLVISQVMELYFGLISFEWQRAMVALRDDDLPTALTALSRSVRSLEALNAAWLSLSWMTPRDFNSFRGELGEGSGFQSAMYRKLEFLLGNKSRQMVAPHKATPDVYSDLVSVLESPSLYDEALAWLARHGRAVPEAALDRAWDAPYEPSPAVEAVWVDIYRDEPHPEIELAEGLSNVASAFSDWKYAHLSIVRRTMGAKTGTGGSSGLAWLERSLANAPFPEMWSARTEV